MIDISVSEPAGDKRGWYKSSYSNSSGGGCVEVKHGPNATLIRDSQDRQIEHPVIGITQQGWDALLRAITGFP